jgi:hypothetical protein
VDITCLQQRFPEFDSWLCVYNSYSTKKSVFTPQQRVHSKSSSSLFIIQALLHNYSCPAFIFTIVSYRHPRARNQTLQRLRRRSIVMEFIHSKFSTCLIKIHKLSSRRLDRRRRRLLHIQAPVYYVTLSFLW